MSYKQVGFDITLLEETYGEFEILSIDGNAFQVDFALIPSITNWPNNGELILANGTGEDGGLWLRQTILDHQNSPPVPSNQIVMVIQALPSYVQHEINSLDFVGGRPPRRPGT